MRRIASLLLLIVALTSCTGDGAPQPEQAKRLPSSTKPSEGLASYYSSGLDGERTASGVPFDMDAMVAAHPTYEFGTIVRVTNLVNQRSVNVKIVDRGPARGARAEGVIIDLSRAAAEKLDFIEDGRTRVRLDVIE